MTKICVLGSGSWGTALAAHLAGNNCQVALWGRPEDGIDAIRESRVNQQFLPGIVLPDAVYPETDLDLAMDDIQMLVCSVPSQAFREVLTKVQDLIPAQACIVNTAKGLELATGLRLSQVAEEILGQQRMQRFAVLSGPSHAEEVSRQVPTAVTVAAYNRETAFEVQDTFMSTRFRVYTNPDVAGVELGGALKNIIALATGMIYGLGYGDNTAAALLTRGLTEMIRMGVAMGGDARTFSGLSGIGDLVVTCGSRHSRNRRAGELIGQGLSLEETLQKVGMVVEGAHAIRIVHQLAVRMNIEMPITRTCYQVLYEGQDPREGVEGLMKRSKKNEMEEIVSQTIEW